MSYLHVLKWFNIALSRVQWSLVLPFLDEGTYLRGDRGSLPQVSGHWVFVAHLFVFLLACTQSLLYQGQGRTHLDLFLVGCPWWLYFLMKTPLGSLFPLGHDH